MDQRKMAPPPRTIAPHQGQWHLSGAAVLMATSFTKNSQFPNIVKTSFSKNNMPKSIKTLMLHS